MSWYYDSGSDTEYDETVDRLTFPYEETQEDRELHETVLGMCKEKFKDKCVRACDFLDGASFTAFNNFDAEICKDYLRTGDEEKRSKGLLLNGLAGTCMRAIEEWKHFIDEYIFWPKMEYAMHAIDFVDCMVLNGRGVQIDYAKTAKNLIAEEKVNFEDKVKIASVHCLKEEIVRLTEGENFPELSEKTYEKTRRLVEFWKRFIQDGTYTEDPEKLIEIVGHDNYDGIVFFREKLTEEQRQKAMVYVMYHTEADLQTRFLDEMSAQQQQFILRECGERFLINLMNNEHWMMKFYEVAIFARHLLSDRQYYEMIKCASEHVPYICACEPEISNDEHLQMFHFLWKRAPEQTKLFIYEQEDSLDFFWFLKKTQDFGFFKRFFTRAPQQWKCKFVERKKGMRILMDMYTYNEAQDLFHDVVKSTYPNEKDATEYKIRFMNEYFSTILRCLFFINMEKATFDVILKNVFGTKEAILKFKKQYLSNSKTNEHLKTLIRGTFFENDFTEKVRSTLLVRQLLQYVGMFVPNSDLKNFKKIGLCQNKEVKKVFLDLMKINRYNPVEVFLKWSIADVQLITEYKRNFYNEDLKDEIMPFVADLVQKNDELKALTKFAKWCSWSPENQREIGDMILNGAVTQVPIWDFSDQYMKKVDVTLPLWRFLLNNEHFKLADDFLKWCGKNTEEEMKETKKQMFSTINLTYILYGVDSFWKILDREMLEDPAKVQSVKAKAKKITDWFGATSEMFKELMEARIAEDKFPLKDRVVLDLD